MNCRSNSQQNSQNIAWSIARVLLGYWYHIFKSWRIQWIAPGRNIYFQCQPFLNVSIKGWYQSEHIVFWFLETCFRDSNSNQWTLRTLAFYHMLFCHSMWSLSVFWGSFWWILFSFSDKTHEKYWIIHYPISHTRFLLSSYHAQPVPSSCTIHSLISIPISRLKFLSLSTVSKTIL